MAKRKLKIGIDIRAIGQQRTGDETYTLNLVRELLKNDKNNNYFLFTNTKKEESLKNIQKKIFRNKSAPSNVSVISVLPSCKLLWTFFALPLKLFQLRPDILHVQYISPLITPRKTKVITTIHDISFVRFPQFIDKKDLFFLKCLIPVSLKKACKVIGVSDFTRKEIVDYYKNVSDKTVAIYNGGPSSSFIENFSRNSSREALKDNLKEFPYLFYVGTHQPRKNIPFLIKTFLKLKKEYSAESDKIKNLKLCIGGKRGGKNYDEGIEKILKKIGSGKDEKFLRDIVFCDYIDESTLPVYYKNAECFVFPSLYEGFGLPLLEAMQAETPIVCSDIDCFREIAGEAAVYFNPGSNQDLSKKIARVVKNSDNIREYLTKKGKKRMQVFSWEKCAKETLKVYNNC
ncbi:MAG: glycosyltransferase family 4 protein [Patescibacteria group bacterium]